MTWICTIRGKRIVEHCLPSFIRSIELELKGQIMKRSIYKYSIRMHHKLELPYACNIIHFDLQHGVYNIWVEVDTESKNLVTREFKIHATGDEVDLTKEVHIKSLVFAQDSTVWHLYEVFQTPEYVKIKKVNLTSTYGQCGTTAHGATVNTPERQLELLKSKYAEICEENRRLEAAFSELQAKMFVRLNNQECWLYQGDGEDNLHSLVCPVVIDPTELMHIIELAEQYKGLCD